MSLEADGRRICCDGEGCHAFAYLPVALRPQLIPLEARLAPAAGWLFINTNGASRHFCPLCALTQLDTIAIAPIQEIITIPELRG